MLLFLLAVPFTTQTILAEKTDPNHQDVGGYGYLISQTPNQTLWWSEGAYKVMKDAPVPSREQTIIRLESAKNEWESFILVSRPSKELQQVNVQLSAMTSEGYTIPASAFTVRRVEYVPVTHPTDDYGFVGEWPDPLPLNQANRSLKAEENNSFWISIKTPKEAEAGKYKGYVTLTGEGWTEQIPLSLEVWNFTLPDTPTLRSGFGFDLNNVVKYNNLTTEAQKQKAFDMHMKAFADYKISPYNPFELAPVKETITGVDWQGGFFDSKVKHGGKYSYMVVDNSYNSNAEASLRQLLPIKGDKAYQLDWWTKSKNDKQSFVIGVECYDQNDQLLWFENRFEEFVATTDWKNFSLPLGHLSPAIHKVMIRLYPSKRTSIGENLGTVWFDDMTLTPSDKNEGAKAWVQGDDGLGEESRVEKESTHDVNNLLICGNFEVDVEKIDIQLDFTDFNKAAQKYFHEYGFNSYRCSLKGLGGGTYYSRTGGVFEGFAQGTEEYNRLMQRYLKQMESNLEANGVLGKEYIYWFDEPGPDDYPFIHETNAMLKKYAPKMTTFLTEHMSGYDISDVTDISCTIWHKLDHEKAKKMHEKGLSYWSYLCCWPKSPWISEFIDHDAVNMRMWVWASYKHHLSGILIWQSTYWNSLEASPDGKLQNPWTEAMSWVTGYGWVKGKQTVWGNGDGRMFYPENRNVNTDRNVYNSEAIPSVRLEILRDGIEDYEYFKLLENLTEKASKGKALKAKKLLQIPTSIYTDEKTYNKDPQAMLKFRRKLAKAILSLQE